jgi:hypothetical protein
MGNDQVGVSRSIRTEGRDWVRHPGLVLELSIPTPREPALGRKTTADDGNTHLKQAENRRIWERVETWGAKRISRCRVYASRQAGRLRGTLFLPGTRRSATADSMSSHGHRARYYDLSRQQQRQLRRMSLMTLHLGSRPLYMGAKTEEWPVYHGGRSRLGAGRQRVFRFALRWALW